MSKLSYGLDAGTYTLASGQYVDKDDMGSGGGGGGTTGTVFEDYEHTDPLADWTIPSQTGTVDVSTSTVYSGSKSMNTESDGLTEAYISNANLPTVPQPGDKWQFFLNPAQLGTNAQIRYYFARQSAEAGDCYVIQMYKDGTFRLQTSGGTTVAATYDVTYPTWSWLRVNHYWEHPDKGSDHVLELRDMAAGSQLASVSGNDTTYNKGNIGVRMNDTAGGFWDRMRIAERTA